MTVQPPIADAGEARSPGPSVQQLIKEDSRVVPDILRGECYEYLGSADISKDRYLTDEFHRLEVERVWTRTWQMACREDDIAAIGDHVVYEIGDYSLVVTRVAGDTIRAYHNACLHRGTQLRAEDGNVREFRCPFHGFTWNLDGSLKNVPCRWDFPHVDDERFSLPQAHVASWGGFVFVHLGEDPEPLDTYLEDLPEHFAPWPLEKRWKAVHVQKVISCNWKVALEAFMESYHVAITHPQLLRYTGDANTQYDVYAGRRHFNRMITAFATPSPHIGELDPQDVAEAWRQDLMKFQVDHIEVAPGTSARTAVADAVRRQLATITGSDLKDVSDSEAIDAIQYFLFPNMMPWAGYGSPITYRFRPYGNDPHMCVMDVMLLFPWPEGMTKPPAAKPILLGADDPWTNAPQLGALAAVFEQDMQNLPRIQRGLRAMAKKDGITLGNYQEVRIRQFHQTLDAYVGG